MPEPSVLLAFTLACLLIVIVPGPTVTVIIANSIRHGAKAGLLNVVGTQIGLAMMLAVLAAGLAAVVAGMGSLFEILRIVGAAYLIWLGIKMWRSDGSLERADVARPMGSFIIQGFIVIWSNPKALIFFGAFIPQFIDQAGSAAWQTVFYGAIFMVVGAIFDSLYAIAAGGARSWLSAKRSKLTERISGTYLIGGGVWLALARR